MNVHLSESKSMETITPRHKTSDSKAINNNLLRLKYGMLTGNKDDLDDIEDSDEEVASKISRSTKFTRGGALKPRFSIFRQSSDKRNAF